MSPAFGRRAREADSVQAVLDLPWAGGLSTPVGGQSAGGSGGVPFSQVLSLLCLFVQLGLSGLKNKNKMPRDLTSTFCAAPSLGGSAVSCSQAGYRECNSTTAPHGAVASDEQEACWAWTAHRAVGSSSASCSHSRPCRCLQSGPRGACLLYTSDAADEDSPV